MVVVVSPVTVLGLWSSLDVSDEVLAAALSTDRRTLESWRSGTHPPRAARDKLAALARLHARLVDSLRDPHELRAWLHSESRYLGGVPPVDALRAGSIDRIEAVIESLDSGLFV